MATRKITEVVKMRACDVRPGDVISASANPRDAWQFVYEANPESGRHETEWAEKVHNLLDDRYVVLRIAREPKQPLIGLDHTSDFEPDVRDDQVIVRHAYDLIDVQVTREMEG